MNVREGFARLARVSAIVYWIVVAVVLGSYWYKGMTWSLMGSGKFSWTNFPDMTASTGYGLLFCAAIYGALWIAFRGLRWVARGFMTTA